ncbi:basic proline-rich protein-like [Tripterygium wilfordii]|nr:basic proline-rich protein-like [Tripterygium wilfordii]
MIENALYFKHTAVDVAYFCTLSAPVKKSGASIVSRESTQHPSLNIGRVAKSKIRGKKPFIWKVLQEIMQGAPKMIPPGPGGPGPGPGPGPGGPPAPWPGPGAPPGWGPPPAPWPVPMAPGPGPAPAPWPGPVAPGPGPGPGGTPAPWPGPGGFIDGFFSGL